MRYIVPVSDVTIEMARKAKDHVRTIAAGAAGVTGIGLARVGGSYAVKVNLRGDKKPDVPLQVDGVPVVFEQTGSISPR